MAFTTHICCVHLMADSITKKKFLQDQQYIKRSTASARHERERIKSRESSRWNLGSLFFGYKDESRIFFSAPWKSGEKLLSARELFLILQLAKIKKICRFFSRISLILTVCKWAWFFSTLIRHFFRNITAWLRKMILQKNKGMDRFGVTAF